MCNPVLVGAAIGAGMAAVQGGDIEDIAIGGVIGGASAGIGGGSQAFTAFSSGTSGASAGIFSSVQGEFFANGVTAALTNASLGTALLTPLVNPPSYDLPAQATPVAFQSNQTIATTGSGGKAAAASLAEAIKRSKSRKLTQEDVSDLSIDTSSFASQGLQLT
jgi:hypothetical protein